MVKKTWRDKFVFIKFKTLKYLAFFKYPNPENLGALQKHELS